MNDGHKLVRKLTNIAYSTGCFALYTVAAFIIGYALYGCFKELNRSDFIIYELLDEIGLIIFALAVLDIAKYLLEEEVLKSAKERNLKEMRRTLTKIVSIISTALFLKGLIMTMETSKTDITQIVFPLFVVCSPVLLMIGLGIFHYLSQKVVAEETELTESNQRI